MNPVYYYLLHVFSLFALTAQTFMAFANPAPENRRRTMMLTGILSLLVLGSGFGLIARVYQNHIAGWMLVKLACWLVLSMLAGVAFRRPALRRTLSVVGLAAILLALVMVYVKPAF